MPLLSAMLASAAVLVMTTPALAYLEPASVSLVAQLIVGALAGGLVAIKLYWRRLLSYFRDEKENPQANRAE